MALTFVLFATTVDGRAFTEDRKVRKVEVD